MLQWPFNEVAIEGVKLGKYSRSLNTKSTVYKVMDRGKVPLSSTRLASFVDYSPDFKACVALF